MEEHIQVLIRPQNSQRGAVLAMDPQARLHEKLEINLVLRFVVPEPPLVLLLCTNACAKSACGKRAKSAERVPILLCTKSGKIAKYAQNVRKDLQTPDVELDVEAQSHVQQQCDNSITAV
jgi:hypothetical protein